MPIEPGDTVTVEYVGRLEDGHVFNTSRYEVAAEHGLVEAQGATREEYTPLTFTVGTDAVIAGLDEALVGMTAGETASVTVPPEEAYGEFDDERVRRYDAETFEAMVGQDPEVGLHVHAENGLHGDVTAVRDGEVEVDFNHELAGKTLVLEIEVVDVR
ncbi:peptidyl-prolyl cis-trans isomerase B (cyclophilin B) [Halogranum amylolyticum]|uniref:Peptidyl-prolyl cis-trans isomerase n=1 Tax=Halogranum amylolyticum TaxID=660520 RepID=A0A1H8UV03_9EURY|nr:peptidylprolyl isomerase [Halogranum amylolyticum]SEP06398.1 peptidyl-prolyl cis-trans isomerase B (cyclophilin B) [Halogranum amylolyticum]